ncbi:MULTISPECIES: hypothetical protein [unclassified Lentimonas]|uniref:hypothetical protein n=1 Tax=unclassified Lentimonas TaxID=2630993 RepID=UPI001321A01C|nr:MULTISPECIES: hypothetical protein [unclassified Lentimonas]CAA6696597.1 Unannotated [Lentimonas sp. CC10]CAA6697068.1 Unannotated [Lentimonas sp. CC19]CAA7069114.1 Unannotated [Lentimonas sp. CC11]
MKTIPTILIASTICLLSGCAVSDEVIMQRERLEHERKMQSDQNFHEFSMGVHQPKTVKEETIPHTLREDESGNILIKNAKTKTEYIIDFDNQTLIPK